MVDYVALVAPPKLLGPTGKPANGDIYVRSTANISLADGIVTPFQEHGKIVDGEFKDLDGGPLRLAVTPAGVALDIYVELVQDGPGGRRDKHRIVRTVSTPNATTVTWAELVDVVPVDTGTDYEVPSWVSELLTEAAAAAGPAVAAKNAAEVAADRAVNAAASVPTEAELEAQIGAAVSSEALSTVAVEPGPFKETLTEVFAGAAAGKIDRSVEGQDELRTQNDTAFRAFRAALAGSKRGLNTATICVFGDSKSEGENASPGATYQDVWTRYLLGSLRSRWNPASIPGGDGFIPAKYAYVNPANQGFALAGTVGTDYQVTNAQGPGARNVTLITATGGLSITKTFTSADMYFYNTAAGTKIDVTVDGTTTTYTTNSSGSNQKVSIGSGLAATPHTVTIKKNTTSPGNPNITGVDFFNGDTAAGVRLFDSSHYGYTTTQALSILGNIMPALVLAAPDLVIIKLGTNDYSSMNAATFKANLTQLLSTHSYSFENRLTKVPSYLVVIPEARTAGMVSPIGEYTAAAYEVAEAMTAPCGVLDLSKRMPPSSGSSPLGLWSADGIHENSKGHQFVADAVERVLLG